MIPILQCGKCKYSKSFKWDLSNDVEDIGKLICSQYPEGIPNYVENATAQCDKFEEKK